MEYDLDKNIDNENSKEESEHSQEYEKVEPKDNKNEQLESKLAEAYGKHDDIQNKYLRVHADLENIKKRAIKERADIALRTRSQIISDLLPILDAFQMGLNEAAKFNEAKKYVEGFDMAINQLESVLNGYGLVVIEPSNEPFDPKIHEAIGNEFCETLDDDHVVRTIRCGYRLGEKLLRPASVIVTKPKENEE